MGVETAIGWTDHTFNPWWGCARVSPGCQNCYAEAFAKRTGNDVWGANNDRRRFGDKHWAEPLKWDRKAEADGVRRRVFCASMADVFEDREDHQADRQRLWDLIEETPHLDWQLLTKRPENVLTMTSFDFFERRPNVWIGTTVEDQKRADERIPHLLAIPAAVRFLSCEPLLGPVSFRWAMWAPIYGNHLDGLKGIHWVIVGGESGPRHRSLNLDWAREIRRQCDLAGVAYFFKQVGGRTPKAGGDLLDGERLIAFPGTNGSSEDPR